MVLTLYLLERGRKHCHLVPWYSSNLYGKVPSEQDELCLETFDRRGADCA